MNSVKPKNDAEALPRKAGHVKTSESICGCPKDQPEGHRSSQGRNDSLEGVHPHSWRRSAEVVARGSPSEVRMSSLKIGSDSTSCDLKFNVQSRAGSISVDEGTMAQGQITPGVGMSPISNASNASNSENTIHAHLRHDAQGKMCIRDVDIDYMASNPLQECKYSDWTKRSSALGCYEIATVTSQGTGQYSEHTRMKQKLLGDVPLFPQQAMQNEAANIEADIALEQRRNRAGSQVKIKKKRDRTVQDNVGKKMEHYKDSLSTEISERWWKGAKTHQNALEYAQSSDVEFGVSDVGIRGGGTADYPSDDDIRPNTDEDSEIWREVSILRPQDDHKRKQEEPPSVDAAVLEKIGYIANCDKRDPEVVRAFHNSMMQSVPVSLGCTGNNANTTIVNTTVDARIVKPSNLDEVRSLQEALESSRRSFSRLVGQAAPSSGLWDSYLAQWTHLQRRLTEVWVATGRQGYPPNLTKLERWEGRIQTWHVNPVWTPPNLEPLYTSSWRGSGFELATQQMQLAHEFHDNATRELREAKEAEYRRSESIRAAGPLQDTKAVEPVKEVLASIVAKDADEFISWLATKGREHYIQWSQTHITMSWRDYCDWYAPSRFEIESHPQNLLEPGCVTRTNTFHESPIIESSRAALQEATINSNAVKNREVVMGVDDGRIQEADAVKQRIRGGTLDRRVTVYLVAIWDSIDQRNSFSYVVPERLDQRMEEREAVLAFLERLTTEFRNFQLRENI